MRRSLLAALLLLAACGREEPVAAPTAEEAERLDAAEAMLNDLDEEGPPPGGDGPSLNSEIAGAK
jgi:predicted small lipoprotein YifL